MRHGIAEAGGSGGDAARDLTADGVAGVRSASLGLRRLGVRFDLVLSSPFLRARRTSEELLAAVGAVVPFFTSDGLKPGADAATVVRELAGHAQGLLRSALVVGHMPDVGAWLSALTRPHVQQRFEPGEVAAVRFADAPGLGSGDLVWKRTTKVLSAVLFMAQTDYAP